MEPEGLLSHLQDPATCPYPEPDRSSLCPHPTSLISILMLSFHLRLGLPSGFFPSGFPTKTLYAPPSLFIYFCCSDNLLRDQIKQISW
jgi:hypothetical protein